MLKKQSHKRMEFTELFTTVATGGTNAWVDTDTSASLPANCVAYVLCAASGGAAAGVRKVGSALDRKKLQTEWFTLIVQASTTGHIELWNAATATYILLGYWT